MKLVPHLNEEENDDRDVIIVTQGEIVNALRRWGVKNPTDTMADFLYLLEMPDATLNDVESRRTPDPEPEPEKTDSSCFWYDDLAKAWFANSPENGKSGPWNNKPAAEAASRDMMASAKINNERKY